MKRWVCMSLVVGMLMSVCSGCGVCRRWSRWAGIDDSCDTELWFEQVPKLSIYLKGVEKGVNSGDLWH